MSPETDSPRSGTATAAWNGTAMSGLARSVGFAAILAMTAVPRPGHDAMSKACA